MDGKHYNIIGEGYDETGRRYFQIEIDGSPPLTFAADTILADPSRLFKALANAGVNCFSSKSKAEIINEVQSFTADQPSFRVATKLGSFHKQFVLPDQVYGSSSKLPTVVVFDDWTPLWCPNIGHVGHWKNGEAKLRHHLTAIHASCSG
jgi:hypothetical protein